MVTKQSAILAYMDVFLYLGFAFLVCIPFILLVRQKKDKQQMKGLSEALH